MPCTTILVGKKASIDGSTMIARNDDGFFDVKKLIVVTPDKQKKIYKSKIAHLTIELPDNPLRYTSNPSVDPSNGVWPANGINAANVAMTATETITSNPRVLGADPYVVYHKDGKKEIPGGIGEEDLVLLVLPYIRSAKEGVVRLGKLLETYGTYEPNGIAFSDENEIWWLETIGGHHWIARRVEDDEYVMMPNQLGIDKLDLADALGKQKKYMCSADLKDFIKDNHLYEGCGDVINPRIVFGSHDDSDHVYNNPRAWFMGRYFNPRTYKWDGPDADFTPESDDIPWSLKPEHKISPEEVKYILSSYFQGTEYNPYAKADSPKKGIYRPIGISRTGVMAILQIRGWMPDALKGIEWICFGSNAFNSCLPIYTAVESMPKYISSVTLDCSTENFYWSNRLINALADAHYGQCIQLVERYQSAVFSRGRAIVNKYDKLMTEKKDFTQTAKANEDLCKMAKEETTKALNNILLAASKEMKNGYSRADN